MDLLLDTHIFIWWAGQDKDKRLTEAIRAAIADPENRVIVSAATVWEISIKRTLGKLAFAHDIFQVLAQTAFETLDITPRHADRAGSLPFHHADPFDRLLVAQAQLDGFVMATQDRQFRSYGISILGMD